LTFFTPPPPRKYISAADKLRIFKERTRPTSLKEVEEILSTTIKHDNTSKKIVFLMMLLNYSAEDQQNVSFNAPSSTGKIYGPRAEAVQAVVDAILDRFEGYSSPLLRSHPQGWHCFVTLEVEL